jgi:MFS family permease
MIINTFSPMQLQMSEIYNLPETTVIWVNSITNISPILSTPLANNILETKGLRVAFIWFAISNIIGSWLRCLCNVPNYGILFLVGSGVFMGFGASFVINSLNLLCATWFRPEVNYLIFL